MNPIGFSSLPLSPEIQSVAGELGFEKLTPIQAESLPILLAGRDLIGQSQTGSGKTASFVIPILEKLDNQKRELQAIVLCPTRELATQVVGEFRRWGRRFEGLHVLPLTGGVPGKVQAESLERGAQIAVGTPGRVLDLINRDRIDLTEVKTLVLDEADKMLDMGFEEEITAILREIPLQRQTVFFSATYPDTIHALSEKYQNDPVRVKIEDSVADTPAIEQLAYESTPEEKLNTLLRVLQQHPADSVLIFCNMKTTVNDLETALSEQGASVASLHGDLEQRDRDRVMAMFRNRSVRFLIATDVAARGLDIQDLGLVVNFDLPAQNDAYVHRIGRTGRAGKAGLAISIVGIRDTLKMLELEKATSGKIEKPALGFKNQLGLGKSLREAPMRTIGILGGRKDKLRPGDILGALTGKAGGLQGDQVGKIEIHDHVSYVAVQSEFAKIAFESLREGRIKAQKFQVKLMK